VQSHLISVPDRLLERLGLQDLRTDENASQAAAALDAARFAALLKFAEGENGVSVLSAPRVLTGNGQAAQISVRQTQPDGSATGPALSLTPTLDATGTSVRLDVNLELNLPASPRP
jgi:type II secretory pathway component GspD/PulD (secretin)